jgi:hypothetical protein
MLFRSPPFLGESGIRTPAPNRREALRWLDSLGGSGELVDRSRVRPRASAGHAEAGSRGGVRKLGLECHALLLLLMSVFGGIVTHDGHTVKFHVHRCAGRYPHPGVAGKPPYQDLALVDQLPVYLNMNLNKERLRRRSHSSTRGHVWHPTDPSVADLGSQW